MSIKRTIPQMAFSLQYFKVMPIHRKQIYKKIRQIPRVLRLSQISPLAPPTASLEEVHLAENSISCPQPCILVLEQPFVECHHESPSIDMKQPPLLNTSLLQEGIGGPLEVINLIQMQEEEIPMRQSLPMDPRSISNLSEEAREIIRLNHPEMNKYFYMSPRDKAKHFHTMNYEYRQKMKPIEPPGSAPKKKTIRFKKRFEILNFGQEQKCSFLRDRKSFMELYIARDETRSKPLSKAQRKE